MKRKFWSWEGNTLSFEEKISYESWYENKTAEKLFAYELDKHKGDITVVINSLGGDAFAAEIIYCLLRSYSGKVTTKIKSLAASSASVIAMAGDEIKISVTGQIVIHNPFFDSYELETLIDVDEIKDYSLEEIKENMIEIYGRKTKLPKEKISRLMDAETWLNAEEALKLGFVDEIG